MPQDLARVSWVGQKIKGGAESPGGKTTWKGKGFARQRDCPLVRGGRGPALKTQRGRNSCAEWAVACLRSAFAKQEDVVGTGDLTLPHRLILPLLGGSFAHPTPKVLDIERKSEPVPEVVLFLRGKVCSAQAGYPSPGREDKQSPQEDPSCPSSSGAPQDSVAPAPT